MNDLSVPEEVVPELKGAGALGSLSQEIPRHVQDFGDGQEDAAETQTVTREQISIEAVM